MDETTLYLSTLEDLQRLVALGDDYSMLRASAMLRQLFLDSSPLVHQVNRQHRVKLRFPVCGRGYTAVVLEDAPTFYSALGGIHSSGPMSHSVEQLNLDQFLATPVLKLGPQVLSVRDLISISANVLGGVHKGKPTTPEDRALAEFGRVVSGVNPLLRTVPIVNFRPSGHVAPRIPPEACTPDLSAISSRCRPPR
jgi:hypothetical protein